MSAGPVVLLREGEAMGVDERIHAAFGRIKQAIQSGARMQIAVPRPANGASKTAAGYLREVEGLRRKGRLYGYVAAEPAAVYALLGTVVLAVFLAFLALTDAGHAVVATLPESPSSQVSTFVIAPLLAFLFVRKVGKELILHA